MTVIVFADWEYVACIGLSNSFINWKEPTWKVLVWFIRLSELFEFIVESSSVKRETSKVTGKLLPDTLKEYCLVYKSPVLPLRVSVLRICVFWEIRYFGS